MKKISKAVVKILCLAFVLGNLLLSAHVHATDAQGGTDAHKSCTVCQLAQLSHSATNELPLLVAPEFSEQAVTCTTPKTPVVENSAVVSLARAPPALLFT